MSTVPPQREIVLLGAGHTHLHVLRLWRQAPIPSTRLTCVSDFLAATYSGMLPGTLAGLYPPERMQIELVRLCEAAGVRLIRAEVSGLDRERRALVCREGPPIPFDVLSIGIGSVPRDESIPLDETVLRIKPMQTFLSRLDERLRQLASVDASLRDALRVSEKPSYTSPVRIAVVGGGAGGVEIALCLPARLRAVLDARAFELLLIDSGPRLLSAMPRRAGRLAQRELERRGVSVLLARRVARVQQGQLEFEDGTVQALDLVLWSTGPQAPPVLSQLNLKTDVNGFLLTRPTLQSVDDPQVFVVGDSGTIQRRPTPKAGVYAVRQGPILWGNLHRIVHGRPLIEYFPQRRFLSILATGDQRAILSYLGLAFHGRWCWRLKNSLDTQFVDLFQS